MKNSTTRRCTALTYAAVITMLLATGIVTPADADSDPRLARAIVLLREERPDDAHELLLDLVEAEDVHAASLAGAARWALLADDLDILQRVRAVAEGIEIEDGSSPALDLALGYAYVGLAEHHVKNGTGGSSVALLFADAEARARKAAADHAPDAAWLAARSRYAQGDVEGALAQIDALRASADPGAAHAELDLLEGRLRYERGAGRPLQSDGRPSDAASADLSTAYARFLRAMGEPSLELLPADRRRLALHTAWTAHRLGVVDEAQSAYVSAHGFGGNTARLARRGLASLFAGHAEEHIAALEDLLADGPGNLEVLDAIIAARLAQKDTEGALLALQRRLRAAPENPTGWTIGGRIFARVEQWGEAIQHFERALRLDAGSDDAATGLEGVAQALVRTDFERALRTYELLLTLRPDDPYSRNNLGFVLRERVSPWTDFSAGGVQTLKPDAPVRIHELLVRCRDVYAEAVARIPEDEDESRELYESWNLAGIVNDFGLMLHYFADIQDPEKAERLYLRTLRMTDDGFKDTYTPNLTRLYAFILKDRLLSWYRAARRCKEAVLREQAAGPRMELVPDERKRQAAAEDELRLRARIVRELKLDAEEDGAPWPPEPQKGSGR